MNVVFAMERYDTIGGIEIRTPSLRQQECHIA